MSWLVEGMLPCTWILTMTPLGNVFASPSKKGQNKQMKWEAMLWMATVFCLLAALSSLDDLPGSHVSNTAQAHQPA